jgi:hypothetical protein
MSPNDDQLALMAVEVGMFLSWYMDTYKKIPSLKINKDITIRILRREGYSEDLVIMVSMMATSGINVSKDIRKKTNFDALINDFLEGISLSINDVSAWANEKIDAEEAKAQRKIDAEEAKAQRKIDAEEAKAQRKIDAEYDEDLEVFNEWVESLSHWQKYGHRYISYPTYLIYVSWLFAFDNDFAYQLWILVYNSIDSPLYDTSIFLFVILLLINYLASPAVYSFNSRTREYDEEEEHDTLDFSNYFLSVLPIIFLFSAFFFHCFVGDRWLFD